MEGQHPYPSRTRRLRPLRPMILCGRLHGKAGGRQTSIYGGVAQLGEHLPCKQGVMSSNLTISTDPKGSKASYGSASAKAGVGALKTEYRKANIDQE